MLGTTVLNVHSSLSCRLFEVVVCFSRPREIKSRSQRYRVHACTTCIKLHTPVTAIICSILLWICEEKRSSRKRLTPTALLSYIDVYIFLNGVWKLLTTACLSHVPTKQKLSRSLPFACFIGEHPISKDKKARASTAAKSAASGVQSVKWKEIDQVFIDVTVRIVCSYLPKLSGVLLIYGTTCRKHKNSQQQQQQNQPKCVPYIALRTPHIWAHREEPPQNTSHHATTSICSTPKLTHIWYDGCQVRKHTKSSDAYKLAMLPALSLSLSHSLLSVCLHLDLCLCCSCMMCKCYRVCGVVSCECVADIIFQTHNFSGNKTVDETTIMNAKPLLLVLLLLLLFKVCVCVCFCGGVSQSRCVFAAYFLCGMSTVHIFCKYILVHI